MRITEILGESFGDIFSPIKNTKVSDANPVAKDMEKAPRANDPAQVEQAYKELIGGLARQKTKDLTKGPGYILLNSIARKFDVDENVLRDKVNSLIAKLAASKTK